MGEGDGTVSLLYKPISFRQNVLTIHRSSGYMCVKGWKLDRFNPAKIPVITHEMDHEPEFLDLRGGPKTAGEALKFLQVDTFRSCRYIGARGAKCESFGMNNWS